MLSKALQKTKPNNSAAQIIEKIINLEDSDGRDYISSFSKEQILSKIDRSHIQIIDRFSSFKGNGFNLLEFVRFFLNIISHEYVENLYMTIGLIDLFRTISTYTNSERVTFSNITNFFCEKILEKQHSKNHIEARNTPNVTYINPTYEIKDFIRNPPVIYGSTSDEILQKLSQTSILTDKSKHLRAVNSSKFCFDLKKVFTLDALSEYIGVYDFNCNLVSRIYPSFSKIKKDVVVLNFDFSSRQYRIGAVLKNFSLIFWDNANNNFEYEKSWSTTSYCQHLQSTIKFLDYFGSWITSDKTGRLYFWNLLDSKPDREFKCKYYSSINNITEIASLNLLAVVQESKHLSPDSGLPVPSCSNPHIGGSFNGPNAPLQRPSGSHFRESSSFNTASSIGTSFYQSNICLYNYFSGQLVTEISNPEDRVPHTICYSEQYQILFSAGLEKKIKLYEINPTYVDSNLKGELIGHEDLITTFTLVRHTSLLVSCDDKGKIKLWDFKNFACIQTLDFSDKSVITNLLDMIEIGRIGVFGSRIHYVDFEDKVEVIKQLKQIKSRSNLLIEHIDHDQTRNELYIFTQKDLRVLDLNKGMVKYIYGGYRRGSNGSEEDPTCFKYFSCIGKFAIGNEKGEVAIYQISTGDLLYTLKNSHEGSILGIEYDQRNKLFVTHSTDSKIMIHRENDLQLIRELRQNFDSKQISCLELSVYHNLIAIASNQKQHSRHVFLWNYEFGKISGQIVLPQDFQVCSMQFINGYNILMLASFKGQLQFVKIEQQAPAIEVEIKELCCRNLKQPIRGIMCDIKLKGGKKFDLQECSICVSYENGTFQNINLTSYLKSNFKVVASSRQKTNYNPFRECKENFSHEVSKKKHFVLEIVRKNEESNGSGALCQSVIAEQKAPAKRTLLKKQTLNTNFVTKKDLKDSSGEKQLTNGHIKQKRPSQNQTISNTKSPQCHFEEGQIIDSGFNSLNSIKMLQYEKRYIALVGNHRRLKVFNESNVLICDMNINYPLPYKWQFEPKVQRKIQDKVYFAIKVMNSIIQKYESDISVGESKNFKLKELFDRIENNLNIDQTMPIDQQEEAFDCPISLKQITEEAKQSLMITEPEICEGEKKGRSKKKEKQKQKIPLIQEQYSRYDLNFELVKQYNFHDVAGPTLKELDHTKKIELLQKEWKYKDAQQQEDRSKLLRSIQTKVRKNQEKQQLSNFLSPKNLVRQRQPKDSSFVANVRKKIENLKSTNFEQAENSTSKENKLQSSTLANSNMKSLLYTPFANKTNLTKSISKNSESQGFFGNGSDSKKSVKMEDLSLFEKCSKRYKIISKKSESMKRLHTQGGTVESFQDYFQQKRQERKYTVQSSNLKMRTKTTEKRAMRYSTQESSEDLKKTFEDVNEKFVPFKADKYYPEHKRREFINLNFSKKESRSGATPGNAQRLLKKPQTGNHNNRFRMILTELNDRVREKRIQKINL